MARSLAALLLLAAPLFAQEKPPLRWGGDANGGAPFIFEEEGKPTGFEYEFAAHLADKLGRKAVFVQNQWDNIPELLKRPNQGRDDDIDIALNGFEYSAERHAESPTTVPYFVYAFRLIGRKDDKTVNSWHTLGTGEKKQVGVLRGTASQRYMEQRYGGSIELVPSETVTEMLNLVSEGRVDCTVQDSPAAAYYVEAGRFPELRVVDEPVGSGYYVILTRPGDVELRGKLTAAIREAIRSGWLRDLYKKYGLWNAAQQRLLYLSERPWPEVADELTDEVEQRPPVTVKFENIAGNLVTAAGMTILLAVVSFPVAVMVGVLVAIGRVYGPRPVRFGVRRVRRNVFRGTPAAPAAVRPVLPRPPDRHRPGNVTAPALAERPGSACPRWPRASWGWRSTTRRTRRRTTGPGCWPMPRGPDRRPGCSQWG